MKTLKISLLLTLISTALFAQTKLIEEVKKKGDELVIPYKKYELNNGLTLIVHEDKSDPLVHVDVTYHVGSAREELQKSGFAHFFEHMMFQGSNNVADEEHFKIVTESGGTLNGTTNRDRTNYFETVPANQLETMLWLESDRMGYFLDAVTQQKFEVQRATVKNEKGQNYDNSPYGRWSELTAESLYPYGHPYSWLTIGKLEDLDRVDVEDLKKFFMRWYGPNNATLTIGGDVEADEVVSLVEKYFGDIPRGPEVEDMKLAAPVLDQDRYVSYEDNNIRFPALLMTFPTVPRYHEDEPALDAIAQIIGTGKESFFYKNFVETQQALQASVFARNDELAGEMTFFVLPYPGKALSDFEQQMRSALKEFEEAGVTQEDIDKFKAQYEARAINGLATVSGKVSRLAADETFRGEPSYITKDLDRYMALTKEDVVKAYNKYIKGKPAVILSVLPAGAGMAAAGEDNYTPEVTDENPFPTTDYSGLAYSTPTSRFDRTVRPTPGASPLVPVPDYWTSNFKNGIRVIGTESSEIPTVSVQLTMDGGQKLDAVNPKKAGLAAMTAEMMNEGTENYTAAEIEKELEKLGSSISIYSGGNSMTVSASSLVKNIDRTLELMEEKLFRPNFTQEDFDRIKKQQLEAIEASAKDPGSIASQVFDRLLYGDEDIRSLPVGGIKETVESLTLADVKDFYNKYYSPAMAKLVVVGDVDKKEVLSKLDFLKDWKKKPVNIPAMAASPSIDKTRIYLIDKPEAPQSQVRVGYVSDLKYDATGEYFRRYLMNYPLGGAFNSRINLNLREDKGWTYGARSYYSGGVDPGPFVVSAGVKANTTDSTVYEVMNELKMYSEDGITNDELAFLKQSVGNRDARSFEAPYQKAGFLNRILTYDLDKNYVAEQSNIVQNLTKEEVDMLAKKHLPLDKMHIVVVGDKATVGKALERLGYEVVELDAKGEPVTENMLKTEE